jgi:DNA-binding beta-propeller fold protein YncE
MTRLSTTTKLMCAGIALSLGWIVLEACSCNKTEQDKFPGSWVACFGNTPTLMAYQGNSAVLSFNTGNFNPMDWDCTHPNSPHYKNSQANKPYPSGSPSGPLFSARPHVAGNSYPFIPEQLLTLPFTPFVPPPATTSCQSTFPDVLRTNHTEGTVVRISTCPLAVKTTIPVFEHPLQVVVTPDGTTAVVTSFGPFDGSGGAVNFINLSTNQVTSTVMMPSGVTPNGLAISPDGTTAYIGNFTTPGQSIVVMNIASQTITATIPTSVAYPSGLTLTPDGSQLWIASPLGSVTEIVDTLSQTTVSRLNVQQSVDIAFNSTGTIAYVTSDSSTPGKVFVVDASTYQILSTYAVGNGPSDISMSYGDQFLVVNNDYDGTVSVIDLTLDMVITSAQLGTSVSGIAFVQ